MAKLPENYEAWIVGAGPLDVRALVDALGVKERVKVLGRLGDQKLQGAYGAAAIICLPPKTSKIGDQEGTPVALMEAMAHGLPIVTTRHAGIPEFVEEILVNEGDTEALAPALTSLGHNPDIRMPLGQRNREIVSSRYSNKNVFLPKALFGRVAYDSAETSSL